MQKIYILVYVFILFQFSVKAQNISLTATAGTTTASYGSLKSAFDGINNGTHQGDIIIFINKNSVETANCLLDSSGNVAGAAYTSLTIRPADTATVVKTISLSLSGNTLVTLRGATNVNFDGRPGGTGSNNFLTFSHTSNSAASHTMSLAGGASNNSFNYCTFKNATTGSSASSAVQLLSGPNSNDSFYQSVIMGGNAGIEIAGLDASPNDGVSIVSCQLVNQKSTAIRLTAGIGNVLIDSNRIFNILASSVGYQAIRVSVVDPLATVTVTRNRVYNTFMTSGNPLYGISFIANVASGKLVVKNNSFVLGSSTAPITTVTIVRGIYFAGTASATVDVESNTIRIGGTQTSAITQPTTICVLKSNSSAGSIFTFRNNLCINTRTGSANQHVGAFFNTGTTGTNDIDYNTYYGGPLYITAWVNTFYNDTTAYRAAAAPQEQNSTFGIVDFVNNINPDLQPVSANNTPAVLTGNPSTVLTDIYGTVRSVVAPYRGAYEGAPLVVVPVHLLSFQAAVQKDNVLLTWKTTYELNNKGYQVERSFDGNSFSPLTFINGGREGNAINNYDFTDVNAFAATTYRIIYYRLKQMDISGRFTYSSIVAVTKKTGNAVSAYPNPITSVLHLDINTKKNGIAAIDVLDISGKKLIGINRSLANGRNLFTIKETTRLSNGIYFIRINIDGNTSIMKMTKAD